MTDHGKPNPIKNALADAVGAIRADHDMHEVAIAFNELEPKAIEKRLIAESCGRFEHVEVGFEPENKHVPAMCAGVHPVLTSGWLLTHEIRP